jgi:putative tryptophan/tyrosine transport system substrate-binding protein
MRRRDLIAGMAGSAAMWPLTVRAQQAAPPVVGWLDANEAEASPEYRTAFRHGLSEMGYVEGRDVAINYGASKAQSDRDELVADFVRQRVAVIVAATMNAALAAKAATATIPIVFNAGGDPVATGLVSSLSRPGGNATGVSTLGAELGPKRLGLLHDFVPRAVRFAIIVDPITTFAKSTIEQSLAMAAKIGLKMEAFTARTNREIDSTFASLVQKGAEALIVAQGALFASRRSQFTTLASHYRLPAIYAQREFIPVGGLMSFGTNWVEQYRQVGIYTGRILKGEKPANLPVLQPTKFEFVINLQTARTLGIEVPPGLLAIADEVIE